MSLCMARSIETHGQKIVWDCYRRTREKWWKMSRWCLPSSLSAWLQQFNKTSSITAVSQMRNRYRMLWIIHLSPKPSLKMDENGGSLDTSYPPIQRYPARTPHNGWYRPHQSFHRKLQSASRHLTTGPGVNWDVLPLSRCAEKTPHVGHIAILVVDR